MKKIQQNEHTVDQRGHVDRVSSPESVLSRESSMAWSPESSHHRPAKQSLPAHRLKSVEEVAVFRKLSTEHVLERESPGRANDPASHGGHQRFGNPADVNAIVGTFYGKGRRRS